MSVDVKELRGAERYVLDAPLSGSFGAFDVSVANVSAGGVQILHAMPLRLASSARLSCRVAGVHFAATGRLLWSHLSKDAGEGGNMLYRSGVRIEDPEFAAAIEQLAARGLIRVDTDTLERKRKTLMEKERRRSGPIVKAMPAEPNIPSDHRLLIEHARERLRANPTEAARLFEQAKTADAANGARDEVIAVWEYLERTVGLQTINQVFDGR